MKPILPGCRRSSRLTGWKIDIKSQSQAAEMTDMVDDGMPAMDEGLEPFPIMMDAMPMTDEDDTL